MVPSATEIDKILFCHASGSGCRAAITTSRSPAGTHLSSAIRHSPSDSLRTFLPASSINQRRTGLSSLSTTRASSFSLSFFSSASVLASAARKAIASPLGDQASDVTAFLPDVSVSASPPSVGMR